MKIVKGHIIYLCKYSNLIQLNTETDLKFILVTFILAKYHRKWKEEGH